MGLAVTSFTKPNLAENPTEIEFEADIDDSEEIEVAVNTAAPIVLILTPQVCGTRLDKVISSQIPQFSRSRIQQ